MRCLPDMRAVVVDGPGRVTVRDVARPTIQLPTDALVEVIATGICGTDTHAVAHAGATLPSGTILGHEFVGTVVDVGAAVTNFAPGDRVVGADFTACGQCVPCRRGDHWHCPERQFFGTGTAYGLALPGALAEHVRVPHADTTLGRLPATVAPRVAVLATDALATALTAVERAAVRPGDVVAIIGAGPVGQLTGMVAQVAGASAVIVSEPLTVRQADAEHLGLVTVAPEELVAAGRALTDGRGFDAAIEAVGLTVSLRAAISAVRGHGTVVMVGVPSDATPALPLAEMFRRELDVRFAIGDPIRQRDRMLTMLSTGQIDAAAVLGPPTTFVDVGDAFDEFARGERKKVVVAP